MTGWVDTPVAPTRIGPMGWLRVIWRGALAGGLTYGGLAVLLLIRLVEAPIFGQARPVTPRITQTVCRGALWLMGLRLQVRGRPMTAEGAIVANHSSWLDIFAS
jgi:lyso-ornithine lipid O-acyltransferase